MVRVIVFQIQKFKERPHYSWDSGTFNPYDKELGSGSSFKPYTGTTSETSQLRKMIRKVFASMF